MSEKIPGPASYPLIGSFPELRRIEATGTALLCRLQEKYGDIFQYTKPGGHSTVVVSSVALLDELCDETRFEKIPPPGTEKSAEEAKLDPPGLFAAMTKDPNWTLAHRILVPAFGPLSIQNMFLSMEDMAKQLCLSWARQGPEHRIDVAGDFTRLTLDTIALCGMNYRFNSFYHEKHHPFVDAMNTVISIVSKRGFNAPIISALLGGRGADTELENARNTQKHISQGMVDGRRSHPSEQKDLLNAMITGHDPKTGEQMSDTLIRSNMITFLVAGHETTSSLLSFAFCNMLMHPDTYRAAQEEVDRIVGTKPVTLDHTKHLKYVNAVIRESLRLYPTAPTFSLTPLEKDQPHVRLGEYLVPTNTSIIVLLEKVHRDSKVWGSDADEFKPERMLEENFNALPKNAWKPFGNGKRSCIGRGFALQEAMLATTMLLQRFDFELDDPSYKLDITFQITLKPKNFFMRAKLRHGIDATALEHALNSAPGKPTNGPEKKEPVPSPSDKGSRQEDLTVLYGSNTGTCETLAQRLVADTTSHGWNARARPLDESVGELPKDRPTVIVTASYEGEPPDNAAKFVTWLSSLSGDSLNGVQYAVYGCGHHDWHETFHRVPKLVDETIAARGGTRLVPMGTCDVADSDVIDSFEGWLDSTLWSALPSKDVDASMGPKIEMVMSSTKRTTALRQDVQQVKIRDAKSLTAPGEPEKRHIEVELPDGMSYTCGDYLAVLPLNNTATVRRIYKRFSIPYDTVIKLGANSASNIPTDTWISVHDVLRGYVELTQPVSKKDIRQFAALAKSDSNQAALQTLAAPSETSQGAGLSALDLLERFPSIDLPFATFLSLLPPLRVRLYSISSSPKHSLTSATITYSVATGSTTDGTTPGSPTVARRPTNPSEPASSGGNAAATTAAENAVIRPPGVATSYMAGLSPGDSLAVAVRPCRSAFHLPADPSATPLILVGAGTGLAPFRGFVQERAAIAAAAAAAATTEARDPPLAPAILFVGCRGRDRDALYHDEFAAWERAGVVGMRYSFSRGAIADCAAEEQGYVQDRVRRQGEEIRALWKRGARVYICGAGAVARDVGDALKDVLFTETDADGKERDVNASAKWRAANKEGRVVTDIFG